MAVPDELRRTVIESGSTRDQLLLHLIGTLDRQNAMQEDKLYAELQRIADAQEQIAGYLAQISARLSS
jgi:hypothetical protein